MNSFNSSARVAYIDVLKAFSIIAVVLFHSGFCTFGYLGVDVFLVINGYLITNSLKKKFIDSQIAPGWGGYVRFLFSRVERLLPTLLIASIVCMTVGYFAMTDDYFESLTQSVVATNLFANNFVEYIAKGDYWYFGNTFAPLMHTWYVGLIFQFYMVFPLVFYVARFDKLHTKSTLLSIVTVLAIVSLLIFLDKDIEQSWKFYMLPARFFEFLVGAIVALIYVPEKGKKLGFPAVFAYFCYILLLVTIFINTEIIPSDVKLLLVIALTTVIVCSYNVLENKFFGNQALAKIGMASYSIFVWHQIILAFYKGFISNQYTWSSYLTCLLIILLLSWVSYCYIEQWAALSLKTLLGKRRFYLINIILFVFVQTVTLYLYSHAGVVRNIPELDVQMNNPHRGMWGQYTQYVLDHYDKPFETKKRHWIVTGNSYGLDFTNVIRESYIADSVEVSFVDGTKDYRDKRFDDRFAEADKIFIAAKNLKDEFIRDIEMRGLASGLSKYDIVIVGEKYWGECLNRIYVKRFRDDYHNTTVRMADSFINRNNFLQKEYEGRFINLFSMITDNNSDARAFTDDNKYFSYDGSHITRNGAKYFAKNIEWSKYMN